MTASDRDLLIQAMDARAAHGDQMRAALRDHPELEEASRQLAEALLKLTRIYREASARPQDALAMHTSAAAEWVFYVYGEPGVLRVEP